MRTNQGKQTVQHPWHYDHPLAPNDVRQIRRADGIELALRGVEPLVSGWDFNAFLVDEDWVFRGGCVAISLAYYGHASGRTGMFERSLDWLRRIFL